MYKMNQKGFAPLLIIVGVLVAAGLLAGGYYLGAKKAPTLQQTVNNQNPVVVGSTGISSGKPTPETKPDTVDTSNWKTYTNTQGGFRINYPSDLIPEEHAATTQYGLTDVMSVSFTDSRSLPSNFNIDVVINQNKLSLQEFIAKYYLPLGADISNFQLTSVTIDNTYGLKSLHIPGEADTEFVFVPHGNFIYVFSSEPRIPGQLFDQILSTFKFTN